jgi:PhnB protein
MLIQPYLFFQGRAEEAIDFYRQALGAEVLMMMRMKDSPEPPPPGTTPPGSDQLIMHAGLQIGDALIMVSDGNCAGETSFHGFSLSLTVPDIDTADRMFAALSEGGNVVMPIGETFWSPHFGMVTDRFGVGWMITIPMPEPAEP